MILLGPSKTVTELSKLRLFFATHPLTKRNQLAGWLRFAIWQVRSRTSDEVIVDWIDGAKLAARKGMAGATGNIYAGLHEFEDMMTVLHFLRPGDLFLDVGANIGSFTVLASAVCGAQTWAFEPDPDTAFFLRRNVHVNGIDKLVQIHEAALGHKDGTIRFTLGLDSMNRVATKLDRNCREVQLRRLDDIVGCSQPIMIKMDVEGYETAVLKGAKNTLGKPSLKIVELETVDVKASELLRSHGFELAVYDPIQRILRQSAGEIRSGNALYVRDWAFVEQRLKSSSSFRVLGQDF